MRMKTAMRAAGLLVFLAFLCALPSIGWAQKKDSFPTKPIQNICSWAPGGSSDLSQRLVASLIPKYLGQSMIVVNKPGGAAVPGTTEIARSKPDGYTIGINWYASFVLRPYVLEVPYKTGDFEFILAMVRQRNVFAVRSDSPFKTLKDLVDFAKKNPGKLRFSGSPTASWQHLAGMHFNQVAGIETQFVPYDGGRPSVVAMLGGHIEYIVGQPAEWSGELKAGQIRILASIEKERMPALPDVPTLLELGYKVAHPHMMVIVAPKGVPAERIKKIHDAYKQTIESAEFKELADKMVLEVEYKSGADVLKEIQELNAVYSKLVPTILKK